MGFELFCGTLIALLLGLAVCFGGYRLFLALLPVWGFFFGFGLGAQALQALFGQGFLATTTSWVVGFFLGAFFALLSWLFFKAGVAILAGSLGYVLGAGFMHLIGINMNFLVYSIGVLVAVAAVVVTLMFSLEKYVIIANTAITGAGLIVGTMIFGVTGARLARFFENPIRFALQDRPLWIIIFLVLAALGVAFQLATTRTWVVEPYDNRI
jgi:hypothetical protein